MIYKTQGTCSREIAFDLIDGKIKNVKFTGGCNGNLKGICSLVDGMDITKGTSCPDQLAQALKQAV